MRYALRQFAKNPGFTVVALVTLAIGIGVNTTSFTVLNRLLFHPLPFQDAGSLVQVWTSSPREQFANLAPGDYLDEKEENTVFEDMAAYVPSRSASLAEPGQPAIRCGSVRMTANFFATLGVHPQIGRLFTAEEEERSEPVTLIGSAFWREHFASDPNILGRTIRLNGKMFTIVGVMPPALDDPMLFNGQASVFPLDPARLNRERRGGGGWYHAIARLKPGVTLEKAQAELTALARRSAHDHPESNAGFDLKVIPYPTNAIGSSSAHLTWLTMALSGMVLLIACVNLANLQIVGTTRRAHEIAIRLALGCSRAKLIRTLLLESLLISLAGGALGTLVAKWSNIYIARHFGFDMPLDLRVLGFTFVLSMATGAIFGTVPAWIASGSDVAVSLKLGARGATPGRTRHWLRQALVVVELSLALALLTGAGFFVSGIFKVAHRDLGWKADNVLVGSIELDHDHYGEQNDPRSLAFTDRMRERLRELPGIEAAEISYGSPVFGAWEEPFRIEGQPMPEPGKEMSAALNIVTPEFFEVYGINLIRGRNFLESDRPGARRVVIVSESMAKTFWPGTDPIGKRIGEVESANPEWAEVVGVMSDYRGAADFLNLSASRFRMLWPWQQNSHRFITFNVRTSGSPDSYKDEIRKAIGLLAPDIALSQLVTIKEAMDGEMAYFTFLRRLLLQISAFGLLLAAVGTYGVVATLASERTKEVGIRMALGAQPAGVVWLFLKNGIRLAVIGAAVGVVASLILLRILSRMLPAIPGDDPWVVTCVAFLLVTVALVACWLPARRTTRINPILALRVD